LYSTPEYVNENETRALKNKADIRVKDYHGNTALSRAVHNNRLDAVQVLLKNGADVNTRNL